MISRAWLQAVVLVVVVGFFVLGLLAYRTYMEHPPVPERVVDPGGNTLFTGSDVSHGQKIFLNSGLMEYGSVFGHGAYLGPDFTAHYLRHGSNIAHAFYGGPGSDSARRRTIEDFRRNRYDTKTHTRAFSAVQAQAFRELVPYYSGFFSEPSTE